MNDTHLKRQKSISLTQICGYNTWKSIFRVATHLENLEKSENSKVVRGKSGKMEKVRVTEICSSIILDFERSEELKLQLLAACGPGLWICSSLTLL